MKARRPISAEEERVIRKFISESKMNITLSDINTDIPEISFLFHQSDILKIEDLFGHSKQVLVHIVNPDKCQLNFPSDFNPWLVTTDALGLRRHGTWLGPL